MLAEQVTDVDLVTRYREGDPSAFDELFHRYHARIRALCVRVLGDQGAADDMVQETFYSVVRSLDKFQGDLNFSAWVHRIASNVCIDELRRRKRRLARAEANPHGDDNPDELILGIPDADPTGDPEAALEQEQLRRLIWEVAKRLPERQRMALSMRELEGMSYASIARVMNLSESAVVAILHRARIRFRQEFLAQEGPRENENECAVIGKLLSAIGWLELKAPQRARVEEHLGACMQCTRLFSGVAEPV